MPGSSQPRPQQPKEADIGGKKPQKSSAKNAPTEKTMPSSSKGKQPMLPPPIPSVHHNDRTRKQADGPSSKQPVQENAKGKQVEQSLQKDTKDKHLMPPPPIPSTHYNDRSRKQANKVSSKQPVQEEPKGRQVEQPLQENTKGKQPEQPRPQQSVQIDRKGKQIEQPEEPRPEQSVQTKRKRKQVEQAVLESIVQSRQAQGHSVEQLENPTAEGKQPEQSVQANHKRKQVEAVIGSIKQSEQAQGVSIELLNDPTAHGHQPWMVSFPKRPQITYGRQPSPYQFGQIEPKGKQIEQPGQANLTIQSKQPTPLQSGQAEPKGKKLEQAEQANLTIRSKRSPTLQSGLVEPKGKQVEQTEQDDRSFIEKSRRQALAGKQPLKISPKEDHPAPKGQQSQKVTLKEDQQGEPRRVTILPVLRRPVYLGSKKIYITRLPCSKNGDPKSMRRVKVAMIPSAGRHPQTFLFPDIPDVEFYWGFLNDKATTAQRIVRMEKEGEPTPYFLLACRGEWPEITSPRNDHAIFAGLHEAKVFNDAFVFKVGEPETNERGYVNYVNIEEDLGSVGWIPEAIRNAAMKVEFATPVRGNPGFPDLNNYADPKTMAKDVERMRHQFVMYQKAAERKAAAEGVSPVPPEYELAMLETGAMKDTISQMIKLLHWVRPDALPPIDRGRESSDDQEDPICIDEANAAFNTIREHDDNNDEAPLASTAPADRIIAVLLLDIEMLYVNLGHKVVDAHEMLGRGEKRSIISERVVVIFRAYFALKTKVEAAFQDGEVAKRVVAARIKGTAGGFSPYSPLSDVFRFGKREWEA